MCNFRYVCHGINKIIFNCVHVLFTYFIINLNIYQYIISMRNHSCVCMSVILNRVVQILLMIMGIIFFSMKYTIVVILNPLHSKNVFFSQKSLFYIIPMLL